MRSFIDVSGMTRLRSVLLRCWETGRPIQTVKPFSSYPERFSFGGSVPAGVTLERRTIKKLA